MSGSYYGFTPGGTQFSATGGYGSASFQPAPPGTTFTPAPPPPPRPPAPPAAYPIAPAYNPAAPAQAYTYSAGTAATAYQQPTYPTAVAAVQKQDQSATQQTTNYAYGSVNRAATNNTTIGSATATGYFAPVSTAYQAQTAQQTQVAVATTASDVSTYSGYDAAVYAAAKSYLESKSTGGTSEWMSMKKSGGTGSNTTAVFTGSSGSFKAARGGGGGGGGRGSFPRKGGPPIRKPLEMHYCEICKVSCGAGQTYREHLEGRTHKKKEAMLKAGQSQVNAAKNKTAYVCEVCDVVCSGQDTYQAHVRGAKHQKTVKVYYQMGKPLPAQDTTILAPSSQPAKTTTADPKKVVVVQKMNFIGGEKLTSTGIKTSAPSTEPTADANMTMEQDVLPVGEDYLEIVKTDDGKVTQYHCKLCDCNFTDLGAKEMHMKGRRHRLNFKKKVNPDLEVDVKMTPKMRRAQEDKMRREIMRLRQQDIWSFRAMYQSQNLEPVSLLNFGYGRNAPGTKNRANTDDRYVMAKHSAIYPTDEECNSAQRLVINTEKALKNVSDAFAERARKEGATGPEERLLKGVMRVGDLAKQLLLKGDCRVDLVVLCADKPTFSLLKEVSDMLPDYFKNVTDDKYEISVQSQEAAIVVKQTQPPNFEVKVVFTSVAVRENGEGETPNKPDPVDVLDKQKCLEALASLRHAKWFQARCTSLQFCLIILRILKDLRQRVPTWLALTSWPLELLVEKVLNASSPPVTASEGLRRFFEAVASGILMKCGPGLLDPCEKTAADAAAYLTGQQREDVTASAQQILRLIAFGQIHNVLGMEKFNDLDSSTGRKRPRDNNTDAETQAASNGKKDKRESLLKM